MTGKTVSNENLDEWIQFVEDRSVSEMRYPIISDKLHRLGWRLKVTWKEGIRRTIKWYEENPGFWPLIANRKEENLTAAVVGSAKAD